MKLHQFPVPKGSPRPDKNRPVALAGNAIGLQTQRCAHLWKEAIPGLTMAQVKEALEHTAVPLSNVSGNAQGFGVLRAKAGLDYLKKLQPDPK